MYRVGQAIIQLKFINSSFSSLSALSKLDTQLPVERFEATVSQSTVPSPPLRRCPPNNNDPANQPVWEPPDCLVRRRHNRLRDYLQGLSTGIMYSKVVAIGTCTFTGSSFLGKNWSKLIPIKATQLFQRIHANKAPIIGNNICFKQIHTTVYYTTHCVIVYIY